MSNRDSIIAYCNDYLSLDSYPDYGPNGAQFLGYEKVNGISCAVSIDKEIIKRTARTGHNLLIVHHGMFWNNESRILDDRVGGRLELLEKYGITLLAYHLALDAHPKIGNNTLLAQKLGLRDIEPWGEIGVRGSLYEKMYPAAFYMMGRERLGLRKSEGMIASYGKQPMKSIAVIAGGASHFIVEATRDGFDGFVTGEPGEPSIYLAKDLNMNFFAFGHNKTERFGVQALAQKVSERFQIPWEFIPIENPV